MNSLIVILIRWPKYISQIYLVFIHSSCHTAPQTLGFSPITIGFMLMKVTFGSHPRVGQLPGEPSMWVEDWTFSPITWFSRRGERGLRFNQWPLANDLVSHNYMMLEYEISIHFSILVWKIPWTEEPGRLQSMGCKELDMTEHAYACDYIM